MLLREMVNVVMTIEVITKDLRKHFLCRNPPDHVLIVASEAEKASFI